MQQSWFQRYVLPGFILKSVIIGGGYATGREFAQFFLSNGPWGGLLSIAVATAIFGIVYALSLEFARVSNTYEYRGFFRALLGPGWIVFEGLYLLMMFLVLSVIGATCGAILHDNAGLPSLVGTLTFMAVAAALAYYGSTALERFLVFWSFVLYAFYVAFVVLCLLKFGDLSHQKFSQPQSIDIAAATLGGVKYAGYNISAITATLFCATHLQRGRHALVGGVLGGPLAMLPGVLFYIAMAAFYPDILSAVVPMNVLLGKLQFPVFQVLFLLVLFSTLIGAGTALLHAFNERLAEARKAAGKETPGALRALVAAGIMALSVFAATQIGLVDLVAKGYGVITFAFIAVFAVPLVTVGLWKILHAHAAAAAADIREPARSAVSPRPASGESRDR